MPRNKLAPEPRNSLWSAAKQYVGDVAPGGSLNPEWTPERVEAAKMGLGFTPVVGDVLSGYDALQALRQGNYGEAALSGLGLLPFVPAMGGQIKNISPEQAQRALSLFDVGAVQRAQKATARPKDKESLAFIRPEDFLALAEPLSKPDPTKMRSIRKALSENTPLDDIPFLEMKLSKDQSRARISGHEGRHRALALIEAGEEFMPVRVMPESYIGTFNTWGTARPEYAKMRNEAVERLPSKVRQQEAAENIVYDPFTR